ncbi:MAG: adenylate/guanylate cyclase domain-containing protein [Anaerolineales bacterium]|jgi:class 3 adenylate cyclase/tetratricopeptide (TPR) repeat protein
MTDSRRRKNWDEEEFTAKLQAARSSRGKRRQRRVVTILFCDVTGSTALATQLDPEDWAEIMDEAFDFLIAPVERYGGTIARLMGDAILAFFGAPTAHEDDPERAVLAGLAIIKDIQHFGAQIEREYSLEFNVRVGINTGPVVVGEIGSEIASEYTAMGDAINLAARMEQTAEPGTVQISENTYKLVKTLFDCEPLGEMTVKGKMEAVGAYRVLRRKEQPGRRRGIQGLTSPLIGRGRELDTLQAAFATLRQGRGQIICLIGEAGLGKSRMIGELRAKWQTQIADEALWVESHGISYDASRPYGLFQQYLRQVCDVHEDDSPAIVREKIALSVQGLPSDQQTHVIRASEVLLVVEAETDQPKLEGEAFKHELFDAWQNMLRGFAAQSPFVLVIDDLHWIDSASVELLVHLFQLTEEVPILFLCAFRPYRQAPGWQVKQVADADYPHRYIEIVLTPLSADDSDSLVANLLTISDLPTDLRKAILQKTDGNPFFIEEVIRMLIDRGVIMQDESGTRWQATGTFASTDIPDNVQALLTARIDLLENVVRHTLQLAAVIGRSFYFRVLKLISETEDMLERHLNTLQRVEMIYESARIPELEYIFRHALTRDAAYHSILRRQRRHFHRKVGEALETLFPDRLDEEAPRLAYHFYEAQDYERALKYFTQAGDAAARLYANTEAVAHYGQALEIMKREDVTQLAPSLSKGDALTHLYIRRGRALEELGQFDDAIRNYKELASLAREQEDRALELAALIPMTTVHATPTTIFDPQKAQELSDRALTLARALEDHRAEAKVLWNLMLLTTFTEEDPLEAVAYGEQSLAIARRHNLREELAYALHDLSRPYASIGRLEEARAILAEAQQLWRELGNLPMLADNLSTLASDHFFSGEFDKALEMSQEAQHISQSIHSSWGQAYSLGIAGPVYAERGEMGKAIETWETALPLAEQANFAGLPEYARLHLARLYADLGDLEKAFDLTQAAISASESSRVMIRMYALMVLAQLHLNRGHLVEANNTLTSALEGRERTYLDENDVALAFSIEANIHLANGAFERALTLTDDLLAPDRILNLRHMAPYLRYYHSLALNNLGRTQEALQAMKQACDLAQEIGSRKALWQILPELSSMEAALGNHVEAKSLLQQAREIIEFVADHTGSNELRKSFLALPQISGIMESNKLDA